MRFPHSTVASAIALAFTFSTANAQSCPAWVMPQTAAEAPNNQIHSLVKFNNKLLARGTFTTAGGIPCPSGMAEFDGSAWTPISGSFPQIGMGRYSMAVWNNTLYATGTAVGATIQGRGAVWTGTTFAEWPASTPQYVARFPRLLFPLPDGTLLVEGSFTYNDETGGIIRKRRLVKWDGASFNPLSTTQYGPRYNADESLGNSVYQAVLYDGKVLLRGVAAISTGDAWNTNNIPSPNGLTLFDGTSFTPLGAPALNGPIGDMAVFNGDLYVIGNFTAAVGDPTPLRSIARYSPSTNGWVRCGNGLSGQMTLMLTADDGAGEKLHLFTSLTALLTAYNDPNSTTTDTFTFRGSLMFDGVRFRPHGTGTSSGLSGNVNAIVNFDPGTGLTLYTAGQNLFHNGFTGGTTLARRGAAPSPDTDGDGLLDTWEQNGIDINCDGTLDLNLPALGANWRRKDIFLELDSMTGRAPAPATLAAVTAAFANANIVNEDGSSGISLHIIADPTDQTIPLADFPDIWQDFHALKAERFGNSADRAGPNRQNILDAKRLAFRYCIVANTFGGISSSGNSELPGNDFMVTLGGAPTPGGTPQQQAATIMHELGHTLGLYHGGEQKGERYNFKPNYHSIMNYSWQLAATRQGWTLDYSRRALPDLDELHLDETAGIGGDPAARALLSRSPLITVPEAGPVDWNNDGDLDEDVVANINNVTGSFNTLDTLRGSHDWPRLRYNFRDTDGYASGASPMQAHTDNHLSSQLQALIDAAATPPCLADIGSTGGLAAPDGLLNNNDFIVFIDWFFLHDPRADIGTTGGVPGSDAFFNNNDFVVFINRFFTGC